MNAAMNQTAVTSTHCLHLEGGESGGEDASCCPPSFTSYKDKANWTILLLEGFGEQLQQWKCGHKDNVNLSQLYSYWSVQKVIAEVLDRDKFDEIQITHKDEWSLANIIPSQEK